MATFTGKLGQNKVLFSEVAGALYNMILNQNVETRTIGKGMASLIDEATRDVGLYGDRILKYFTDILRVYDYEADGTDQLNVLKTYRPAAPICQEMVVDTAKFIPLTLDNYLTKQGFGDENTFGQFNSVMEGWLQNTKKVYLAKEYNVYLGTVVTNKGEQYAMTNWGEDTTEAGKRQEVQALAKLIADKMVALTNDASRDYNDLGIEACYDAEDLILLMPSEVWNEITIQDIPTIYHDDRVMEVLKKNVRLLPAKYFGSVVAAGDKSALTANGTSTRFLHQTVLNGKTYMAGDLIPSGTVVRDAQGDLKIQAYQSSTTLAKIYHKDAMPVLAGFETQTEFWNPSNLSRNDYLHFLYNSFDRFTGYPLVTIDPN